MPKQSGFVKKLQAQKKLDEAFLRKHIRQETADIAAIVLHREFGFGPERNKQFNEALNRTFNALIDMAEADTKDKEYTEAKMDELVREAFGKYYQSREERYGY